MTVFAVVAAIALIMFGPKQTPVCGEVSFPNTLIGDYFGHIDGAETEWCYVPPTWVWISTTVAVIGSLLWALVVSLRRNP